MTLEDDYKQTNDDASIHCDIENMSLLDSEDMKQSATPPHFTL